MSEKNENRWWENYLVRYLVPSIAGMFILMWLNKNSGGSGILEKYLPMLKLTNDKDFNTASLTGWLLFGTLYCYIASYTVLVFHAIRVNLFNKISLRVNLFNKKYLVKCTKRILCISMVIVIYPIISCVFCYLYNLSYNFFNIYSLIFTLEIEFSIFQGYFLYKVSKKGRGYAYMVRLAKAKNGKTPNTVINAGYIKDITDSYKHLREHGNTALIILLEILLAFILYFSLRFEKENNFMDFSIVSIILIIWVFPAALVYFYGHLSERKFSGFKNKEND